MLFVVIPALWHCCTFINALQTEICNSKTETLRSRKRIFRVESNNNTFLFYFQIYKLFFVTCQISTVSKYRVYIIASDCILFISVIDYPSLYFNLKHYYLPWGRSAYLDRGTSAHRNQNENRFIRSYYRPSRPLLRPYPVAVAEATWHRPHHMANAVAKVSTFGKQFLAPLLLSAIILVIASAMFMSQ